MARRPVPVLVVTLILALGGAALALRLEPSAATDTLVSRSSDSFRDTERYRARLRRRRGGGPREGRPHQDRPHRGPAARARARGLPRGQHPAGQAARAGSPRTARTPSAGCRPPVRDLARLHPAKAVYGPGTFLNTSASQISEEFLRRSNAASARCAPRRRGPRASCPPRAATPSRSSSASPEAAADDGDDEVPGVRGTAWPCATASASAAAEHQRPELREPGGLRRRASRACRSRASGTSSRAPTPR